MDYHVERTKLPSGEEKLVPCPELERALHERLARLGPGIRKDLRKCRKKGNKMWWPKLIGC